MMIMMNHNRLLSIYLMIFLIFHSINTSKAYWTRFDLVRSKPNGWGSNGNTPYIEISSDSGNGPKMKESDEFGSAVARLGDIDGDGIEDIAVGARGEVNLIVNYTQYQLTSNLAFGAGAVYILFMKNDGTVRDHTHICGDVNGGPTLFGNERFGHALAPLGDLDGNGVPDLAVGAPGVNIASIYILYLKSDGSVASYTLIRGHVTGTELYKAPTFNPTASPTYVPGNPTPGPTVSPTYLAGKPTPEPTASPTYIGGNPTPRPSLSPTYLLNNPTPSPTASPTYLPGKPTPVPTIPLPVNNDNTTYSPPASNSTLNAGNSSNTLTDYNSSYSKPWVPNGPDIVYYCQFGASLAAIGDFNKDGIPDLAAGYFEASTGSSKIYFLYLEKNGTVKYYDEIIPGENGAPKFTYSRPLFGSSIILLPDLDKDGVNEIAVGAMFNDDALTTHVRSGSVYILFLNADATVKKYTKFSELPLESSQQGAPEIPLVANDNCGSALTVIGDLNKDYARQHKPWLNYTVGDKNFGRVSMPDLIVGCPQPNMLGYTGRAFIYFLSQSKGLGTYKQLLGPTDESLAPKLQEMDRFGTSISSYIDIDRNGIEELIIGAPGSTSNNNKFAGKIYILFLRRRRWHPFVPCTACYIASISVPLGFCCLSCIFGTIFFFWYYRRKPDAIELIVVKSGVEITKERSRKKKKFGKESGKIYADEYA